MLTDFTAGVPGPAHPLRTAVLAALRGALRRVHRAGVVHLDLFPYNILWACGGGAEGSGGAAAAGAAAGASVELRLVDFDAALEVGQRVPASARRIVERNGHTGSYHPELFAEGARARPDFDWWHFTLLADAECPFSRDPVALPAWLATEGARERLLAQVAAEVAAEEAAAA
jgi:serine/threonine protein kinase